MEQSRAAFSFFNFDAPAAILNRPCHTRTNKQKNNRWTTVTLAAVGPQQQQQWHTLSSLMCTCLAQPSASMWRSRVCVRALHKLPLPAVHNESLMQANKHTLQWQHSRLFTLTHKQRPSSRHNVTDWTPLGMSWATITPSTVNPYRQTLCGSFICFVPFQPVLWKIYEAADTSGFHCILNLFGEKDKSFS